MLIRFKIVFLVSSLRNAISKPNDNNVLLAVEVLVVYKVFVTRNYWGFKVSNENNNKLLFIILSIVLKNEFEIHYVQNKFISQKNFGLNLNRNFSSCIIVKGNIFISSSISIRTGRLNFFPVIFK